jgi:hypothetical protein
MMTAYQWSPSRIPLPSIHGAFCSSFFSLSFFFCGECVWDWVWTQDQNDLLPGLASNVNPDDLSLPGT